MTSGGKTENLHCRNRRRPPERKVLMAKVMLDLEDPKVLEELGTEWRFGSGWDPGKPNEGLVSQTSESPARFGGL